MTTANFTRIKDYVLSRKESDQPTEPLVNASQLEERLRALNKNWQFTQTEMWEAICHLQDYGYVHVLVTSGGDRRILLVPELLNNLAASIVLEARRNPEGLGALEEDRLLRGDYQIRELADLAPDERDVLIDAAVLGFLTHNVCFRETARLRSKSLLVFPELINLKKPTRQIAEDMEEGCTYRVSGAVENLYASLVVLLGYTNNFTRTDQWQNHAHYQLASGAVCGFRRVPDMDDSLEGDLELVIYFAPGAAPIDRQLFQALFENFLAQHKVTVQRIPPVHCGQCRAVLERRTQQRFLAAGRTTAHCNDCGNPIQLPMAEDLSAPASTDTEIVDDQRRSAQARSAFERAVYQLQSFVRERELPIPKCFICYAWSDDPQEDRWVEKRLAEDCEKAGVEVLLDRWHNAAIGAGIVKFTDKIVQADKIVVVGTKRLGEKYANRGDDAGSVVGAELEHVNVRMRGDEMQKASVMPVLRQGEPKSAFPPALHGRLFADLRNDEDYFVNTFDLLLSIYGLPFQDKSIRSWRELLRNDA